MPNFKIKDIEKKLKKTIARNVYCLAIDTASTSGIAILNINTDSLTIDISIMKIPSLPKDTEDKSEKYEEALEMLLRMIRDFKKQLNIPKKKTILVLENSFLSFSPWTYGYLKGFMGLLYSELFDLFDEIKIIFPIAARKKVGFKSQLKRGSKRIDKKKEIIAWINKKIGIEIKDDNCADALILALSGSIKNE